MGEGMGQFAASNRQSILVVFTCTLSLSACGFFSSSPRVPESKVSTSTTLPVIVLPSATNGLQQQVSPVTTSEIPSTTSATVAKSGSDGTMPASGQASAVSSASAVEPSTASTSTTTDVAPVQSSTTTVVVSPSTLPTLGVENAYIGGVGFGTVEPETVSLGGDSNGVVSAVTWSSWGDATATGSGMAGYVAPGQAAASASRQSATVVAFNLGLCNGQMVYRDVVWYFPQYGETQATVQPFPTCPMN
ncbi:MAG: hypothetical protein M0Z45_03145 [Actinomycetota bacterium]|nr:hypothetical protein [Actinomycetota bacterium]